MAFRKQEEMYRGTKEKTAQEVNFDALEKEMVELNEIKKAWDKAWDRVWEIWGIVAKHETEYYEWKKKKESSNSLSESSTKQK